VTLSKTEEASGSGRDDLVTWQSRKAHESGDSVVETQVTIHPAIDLIDVLQQQDLSRLSVSYLI
jgi:hypothetical protein